MRFWIDTDMRSTSSPSSLGISSAQTEPTAVGYASAGIPVTELIDEDKTRIEALRDYFEKKLGKVLEIAIMGKNMTG